MKKTKQANYLLKIYALLYRKFGPRHWWPGDTRLEIIIGAILTQNTAWSNVERAVANLKKKDLLTVKALSQIPEQKLAELIRPAGYFNIKADRIKKFLAFLNARFGGSINRMFRTETQRLRRELVNVKGIGPETADSILLYAGEKPVFVVDAYTKRIFSRHGYIEEDTDYEEIQNLFYKGLRRDVKLFNEFHALIVELGKNLCRAAKPLCNECPIRRIKNARRDKAKRDKRSKGD